MTYDNVGNVLTLNGPLAGTAATTRYRYDEKRRVVGIVGPDPDGAGTRTHRAQRASYNRARRATLAEVGKVNSQSDGHWAGWTVETSAVNADRRRVKKRTR